MKAPNIGIGAAYLVGLAASVQFRDPIVVRVIKVEPSMPYAEFIWLDVYQLNAYDEAIERRSIYIRPEGLVEAMPRFARETRRTSKAAHHTDL